MSQSDRIEEINQLIIELASGNYNACGTLSDKQDEFDAIIAGINMLGEELKASTVSRDYLKSIYRGVVDMLIVLNNDGIIQEVNKTVCHILAYKAQELIGQSIHILLANKKDKLVTVNNTLNKKGYSYDIEKKFKSKDGRIIPVSCSASLLFDNLDKRQGILYIAKDISKIKKTEDDLRNKNVEMDTFVYKAAHDLKGPLASIMGIAHVAPLDIKDPVALKYFSMIQECTEKLDKVLVNLREIAAIEKAKKEKKKLDLDDLFNKILIENSDFISKNNIKVKLDVAVQGEFFSNEKMFHTIVNNLINNSIKYKRSIANSSIEIKVKDTGGGIEILIKDNGLGIKKKLQPKVFNMFFRAHNSKDGSGLGLYITKTFVNAMSGSIEMKSTENKGTSFLIRLPTMTSA